MPQQLRMPGLDCSYSNEHSSTCSSIYNTDIPSAHMDVVGQQWHNVRTILPNVDRCMCGNRTATDFTEPSFECEIDVETPLHNVIWTGANHGAKAAQNLPKLTCKHVYVT